MWFDGIGAFDAEFHVQEAIDQIKLAIESVSRDINHDDYVKAMNKAIVALEARYKRED